MSLLDTKPVRDAEVEEAIHGLKLVSITHPNSQDATKYTKSLFRMSGLPEDSWLRTYIKHGSKQTVAPLIYHVGMGISLLGISTPKSYRMAFAGDLYTNNYALLLGRSGEDNKSTCLGIGKKILAQVNKDLIGSKPGSKEGLLDSLNEQETQLIFISELGEFLSSAKSGYFEPIKSTLTDLWDNTAQTRVKAGNKKIIVEEPRLSVAAACSIPYLEEYTFAADWSGGFMGRWMICHGVRERVDPDPVGDNTLTQALIDGLKQRMQVANAGQCLGLDDKAKKLWAFWYRDITDRALPSTIMGIRTRAPAIARKIALVLAWDYGVARNGVPWKMGLDVIEPAIAFTELHVQGIVALSNRIAEHEDARMRRSVIDAIEDLGGSATLSELLKYTKRKRRTIQEILNSLEAEGTIETHQSPDPGQSGSILNYAIKRTLTK